MTAKTPGNASALEASMLLINACGTCERSILQNNIRGSTMSSANFVWPTHFARASTLRKGLPITFNGLLVGFVTLVRRYFRVVVQTPHHAFARPPFQQPRKS